MTNLKPAVPRTRLQHSAAPLASARGNGRTNKASLLATYPGAVAFAGLVALLGLASCSDSEADGAKGSASELRPAVDGCQEKACGPTTEEFFAPDRIASVNLEVDEAYMANAGYEVNAWEDLLWESWNSHCGPYEWLPVTMTYQAPGLNEATIGNVGMRLRGSKSRGQNPLAGFKLDYDNQLEDNQRRRFADMNRLEILSNEGDPSGMIQCMSYQLFRDFGLEAPRCNHVQVFVNSELYGLVQSVERAKDGRYLRHHFGATAGALINGSESCGYADSLADLEYKGDTFNEEYAAAYRILRGNEDEVAARFLPMFKCGSETETPDDDDFRQCIADRLDLETWLKTIVVESLSPSLEGFVGARRNFFLYFHPEGKAPYGGRIKVWTWDHDTAMHTATCFPTSCEPTKAVAGWYGPRGSRSPLINRLVSVFKPAYCELAHDFLDEIYDPEKVLTMASRLEPFIEEDPILDPIAWQAEVTLMHDFMATHRSELEAYLADECASEPAADWDFIRGTAATSSAINSEIPETDAGAEQSQTDLAPPLDAGE